jgi:hypothetical protein
VITKVDAIDASKGEYLASASVPGMAMPLNNREFTGQLVVDESGDWTWKILRFRVERGR